ncbi:MAG TPA: hypothetical protein ENJ09_09665 [Planctomycetes bacterium]|nr:hypothetical protein [Planctomycetota bacterium]
MLPPSQPRRTALLAILAAVVSFLAGACASSGTSGPTSIAVILHDYRGEQKLELDSETRTDRVQAYSQLRREASLKVQADEVMVALVREMERNGFDDYAQAGRAPSRGSAVVTRALEVNIDGKTRHWVIGPGSSVDEKKSFLAAMGDFVQLYNLTQAFQAIENPEGTRLFESEARQLNQPAARPRS